MIDEPFEIDRLRAENARLREALEPFAADAAEIATAIPDDTGLVMIGYPDLGEADFNVGDLRRAARAMEEDK